jgi:hypothetical protein
MPIYSVKAHKEIINAIDGVGGLGIGEGAPEIATASRDGSVKIWDPRQNETPVAVIEPAENETKRDAWTVCFGNIIGYFKEFEKKLLFSILFFLRPFL